MTITKTPNTRFNPDQNHQRSAAAAQSSESGVAPVEPIVVESCHSTWIFDPSRGRFCRILKGIEVAGRSVTTAWQPYWQLDLDPYAEDFTVYLNPSRNRLIRSWRHNEDCRQCGSSNATSKLPSEDIQRVLNTRGGEFYLTREAR